MDAWIFWDPYTAAAEKQIGAHILANGKEVVNNHSFFLAQRQYTEKRADVLKLVFDELRTQGQWITRNYPAAASQLAPLQGLDPAIVEHSIRRYSHDIKPINDKVLDQQQNIADTFYELKLIPKEIKVKEAALAARCFPVFPCSFPDMPFRGHAAFRGTGSWLAATGIAAFGH